MEFNTKLDQVEGKISEYEDRAVQFIQLEEQKEIRMKNSEESLKDLWETIKRPDIHIIRSQKEQREKNKGSERLFKKMAENFPNLRKETEIQIEEAQTVP